MNQSYSNISTDGGPPETVTVTNGYSIPQLLSDLAPTASFGFAEIQDGSGPSILLTNAQATNATAFAAGPPVIWQDSTSAFHVLVPSTGAGTANEGQTFTAQFTTLEIILHSGSVLSVSITPSTQAVTAGTPVQFTSAVDPPDPTDSYTWSFGDGSGASTASVSHTYVAGGTYNVYLRVAGSDGSLGFSPMIPITVGKAPPGPNRNGGGKTKKKTAPNSGASVKGSTGKKKKATSTNKSTGAKNSGAATSSASKTTAATTSTTSATPKTSATAAKPPSRHHAGVKRVPLPAGPLLSGIAVAAARARPASPSPAASKRPGATDPARTGHLTPPSHGPGEGFWVVLAALATLISGGLLEYKGRPRILQRLKLPIPKLG
jgi:hypothetical protein